MGLIESLLVIFSIIFVGVACEKIKLFDANQIEGFEIFLFKISIPCYLFAATLNYDFSELLNAQYIFSYLLAFYVVALIVCAYFRKSTLSEKCIRSLTAGYINSAIYTLPIITFLLGDPKAAILSNLLQVVVIQPVFISVLTVIHHKEKSMVRRLLTPFYTPLVIMPIIGLLCNHLQYTPFSVITSMVESLGKGVSSMALFTFGLSLGSIKLSRQAIDKKLIALVVAKNILHPLVAFYIGSKILMLDVYWLSSLVIASSAPTAFIVYLIAKQFSTDQHLIKMTVAISSMLSLVSLILIALILGSDGI